MNVASSLGKSVLRLRWSTKLLWSGSVDCTGRSLVVNGASLPCGLQHSNSLEKFLTSVDTAARVRNTVNTKRTDYSVAAPPLLTNLSLPISERMNAFRVSVASSALWLSGCWTLTETQSSKLGSWSARLLCRMVSCRRRQDETPVDHWRRRHRTGHSLTEQFGLDLPQLCLLQKHRFAGHLARSKSDSLAPRTLTTRDLAWWRRRAQAATRQIERQMGRFSQ